MDEITKAIQGQNINRVLTVTHNVDLIKGKPAQEGEVRDFKGVKHKKVQGKWVPVSEGGGSKKEDDPSKSGGKTESKSGGASSHEVAQLTHMKKVMDSDPAKAYEIYQTLEPEAQAKVPQDIVNKLVENHHTESGGDEGTNPFDEDKRKGDLVTKIDEYLKTTMAQNMEELVEQFEDSGFKRDEIEATVDELIKDGTLKEGSNGSIGQPSSIDAVDKRVAEEKKKKPAKKKDEGDVEVKSTAIAIAIEDGRSEIEPMDFALSHGKSFPGSFANSRDFATKEMIQYEKDPLGYIASNAKKEQLYEVVNKNYDTKFKVGEIEEFEDDDMRTQLSTEDIEAIVDAEKESNGHVFESEGAIEDAYLEIKDSIMKEEGVRYGSREYERMEDSIVRATNAEFKKKYGYDDLDDAEEAFEIQKESKNKKGGDLKKALNVLGFGFEEEIDSIKLEEAGDILIKGKALPVGTVKKRGANNYIKTATGWKYHSRTGGKAKSEKPNRVGVAAKEETEKSPTLPKVGDVVKIKDDLPYMTGLAQIEGDLKVTGYVQGTTSQPKFLKVRDSNGKLHELNPDFVTKSKKTSSAVDPKEKAKYDNLIERVGMALTKAPSNRTADEVTTLRDATKRLGMKMGMSPDQIDKEISQAREKASSKDSFNHNRMMAGYHATLEREHLDTADDLSSSSDPDLKKQAKLEYKLAEDQSKLAEKYSAKAKELHDPKIHGNWNSTMPNHEDSMHYGKMHIEAKKSSKKHAESSSAMIGAATRWGSQNHRERESAIRNIFGSRDKVRKLGMDFDSLPDEVRQKLASKFERDSKRK